MSPTVSGPSSAKASLSSSSRVESKPAPKAGKFLRTFQSKDGVFVGGYLKNIAMSAMKFRHVPYPTAKMRPPFEGRKDRKQKGKEREVASSPPSTAAATPSLSPKKHLPVEIRKLVPSKPKPPVVPTLGNCLNCLTGGCSNTFGCGCVSLCDQCLSVEEVDPRSFMEKTESGEFCCPKCGKIIT